VDELIDAVADAGRMDVIDDFAYPLPTLVGAALLGVPHEDLGHVRRWSEELTAVFLGDPDDVALRSRAKLATLALVGYFRDLLRARRVVPRDDLMSELIGSEVGADSLSEDNLTALCMQLLFSGRGGTPLFFGNGLLALLQHPDQLELLRGDPSLLPTAVEELLRYDAAPQSIARVAAEDLEIDGRRIGKGQLVLLSLAAANRDPAEFPGPDRLDLTRRRNRHVTFGYASHFCVGASLVRIEAQVAFGTLVRRLPGLRLATGSPAWRENVQERMLRSLPVTFTPTGTTRSAQIASAG
jgi:cytochrome P450